MKKNHFFAAILATFFLLLPAIKCEAAYLYFSPSSGEYPELSDVSVKVMVDSSGQAINALEGTIDFPADIFEVKSISKSGSVLELWTKEPVFTSSQVSFSGGVPSPGFSGAGKILTVNFRAKKKGEGKMFFSESLILAADGRGSNISENGSGAGSSFVFSFKIGDKNLAADVPIPTKEEISDLPEISGLYSATHPDHNVWYSDPDPAFAWKSPAGITGLSYGLYNEKDRAVSDLIPDEVVFSKTYSNVESGVWQFHIRAKNKNGWGKDSMFEINIDRDAPNAFDIRIDDYGDPTSPQPSLNFGSKDDLSGIDRYEMRIDDGAIVSIPPDKTNPYVMPIQLPGLHKITINAIDKANNKRESSTEMNVESIEIPEISVYPGIYNAGEEVLYIEGRSIPNASVTIYVEEYGSVMKEWNVRSDENGSWSLREDDLFRSGNYEIFAKATDARGAVSNLSEKRTLTIILNGIALGPWLFDYWTFSLSLLLLILAVIVILLNIYYKIKKEKKKIDRETKEAEESLKNTFKKLRDDLEKKIEYLDSKPGLNAKERKMRNEVFKLLRDSEKTIYKEIQDIEDGL